MTTHTSPWIWRSNVARRIADRVGGGGRGGSGSHGHGGSQRYGRTNGLPSAGSPPPPHRVWSRLDSPLSTYYLLIGSATALLTLGLVMVLSASSVASVARDDSPYALVLNQARFAVVGVILAVVAARMPVAFWKRIAIPVLLVALTLQLLVFTPLGVEVKGNRNWLRLGVQIQPSEIGKLAIVLFGATILTAKRKLLGDWRHAVVPLLMPVGAILLLLVLAGHDLGTGLVLLLVLAGLLWAAGVSGKLLAVAATAAAGLVTIMVIIIPYRKARIASWLSCQDIQGQCWQSMHGKYALADGGWAGLGLGASREKWLWLPEAHNDFIFAIIGEELGIGGTLVVLVLFAALALACYRVVLGTDDMFIRIATCGVMVWILGQAIINIGAAIGMLPVIGVPLPMVSYGGSALMSVLLALGMVASFARGEPRCRQALAARPPLRKRSMLVLAGNRPRWADLSRRGQRTRGGDR